VHPDVVGSAMKVSHREGNLRKSTIAFDGLNRLGNWRGIQEIHNVITLPVVAKSKHASRVLGNEAFT
ncbi:MAG: hypothetical protein ABSC57_04740, partial [Syntrophales bacterium]